MLQRFSVYAGLPLGSLEPSRRWGCLFQLCAQALVDTPNTRCIVASYFALVALWLHIFEDIFRWVVTVIGAL